MMLDAGTASLRAMRIAVMGLCLRTKGYSDCCCGGVRRVLGHGNARDSWGGWQAMKLAISDGMTIDER